MDAATAEALNQLLHSVHSAGEMIPTLDTSMIPVAPPLPMYENMNGEDNDFDNDNVNDNETVVEPTDPRMKQPSLVPGEFKNLLTDLDFRILDMWSRGVATRKISKALKEEGHESMTQKAVEARLAFLKSDPAFPDPSLTQRYLEWIDEVIEERQPKSAQQKWDENDENLLIRLRTVDGLPTKEIAARMRRTPKAIERKWSKLRRKLDLPPTVPNKARTGGNPHIDELLSQVSSALGSDDGLMGQTVLTYRPPPAVPSILGGRKRKRSLGEEDAGEYMPDGNTMLLPENMPGMPLMDPRIKRVKTEPRYDFDAAGGISHVASAAEAMMGAGPGVPTFPMGGMMMSPPSTNSVESSADVLSLLAKLITETGNGTSNNSTDVPVIPQI